MFPYPSGAGLYVGHSLGYPATDILLRFKRMQGFNVLHPMGWDAFALPAEQYAIETGTHPKITTEWNIDRFRSQNKVMSSTKISKGGDLRWLFPSLLLTSVHTYRTTKREASKVGASAKEKQKQLED